MKQRMAFMGGGNMASAIVGGLLRQGVAASQLMVVDPSNEARQRLTALGLTVFEQAGPELAMADLVVWAVKPQVFAEAAQPAAPHVADALHLSVAAGITSDSIATWLNSQRVVRAMPNTPALVGLGQTGLYARPSVSADDRLWVEQVLASTGQTLWVDAEPLLDAVTALSGSGPAYFFYFIETMVRAGVAMGLNEAQAKQLAVGTMAGAAELARTSTEPTSVLRERVTSKGGTTYAALTHMQNNKVGDHFSDSLEKARARAEELGREFG
ncbi:MAG: pyrroline-5-carboxylate reductase [Alphaproteobacteria bacterium]|nr:pyrroline-5-carboxylate reductase [Alphaproteobacteria bacterium]